MAADPDPALDLDAYFDRIGWRGGTAPTYETLAGILRAHVESIPFENLDILLGRPVALDLASLQRKIVAGRRGGYCFEHATLLAAALERIGFRIARHSARVILAVPASRSPRTHMFLTVSVPEGTFVLDPGFGGTASRLPVPLAEGGEARFGADIHRMVRDGLSWKLWARVGGKEGDAWISTLEEDHPVDFEMANHFTSTFPASSFVTRIMLSVLRPDGRVAVMNRSATLWRGGAPESRELADRAALRGLLADRFGFDLPEVETMRVPTIPEWE